VRTQKSMILAMVLLDSQAWAQQTVANPSETPTAMPARVEFVAPSCEFIATNILLRMLQVELAGDGVEHVNLSVAGETGVSPIARVTVEMPRCDAEASEFLVIVDDATTRKSVLRTVDLADIPAATRPRALALAIAELLRASWLELALPSVPTPGVPVPEPLRDTVRLRLISVAARSRPSREPSRWTPFVALSLEGRGFALASTSVAGVRLAGGVISPGNVGATRVRLRLDGGVGLGSGVSLLGVADALLATGGAAITFGYGNALGLECGPRVEFGIARAAGRIPMGSTATGVTVGEAEGFLGGVSVLTTLHGRLSTSWQALVEVEAGWTFGGIDAHAVDQITGLDVRTVAVFGPSISARLGIVWGP
jgi:hypothetical protein